MRVKFLIGVLLSLLVSVSFAASNWFVNTEFKQDFRYRWQEEKQEAVFNSAGDKYTRYRERIRYRFGFETKANDEMNFAGRLATGGTTDPLSTNDTLGENDGFTKDTIVLNQAYLRYTPAWIDTSYGFLSA